MTCITYINGGSSTTHEDSSLDLKTKILYRSLRYAIEMNPCPIFFQSDGLHETLFKSSACGDKGWSLPIGQHAANK
ncbi:hypothetical protein TNCV_761541 [Trichonephila clavipes]|nr:hypothetical protein TNCV_761541 [Trichonephila clavipes]